MFALTKGGELRRHRLHMTKEVESAILLALLQMTMMTMMMMMMMVMKKKKRRNRSESLLRTRRHDASTWPVNRVSVTCDV